MLLVVPWRRSDITFTRMEGLVRRGLIHMRTTTQEWLLPGNEDVSSLPDGYVVSFAHFHKHGLMTSTHKFLQGLLHYY